MPYFIAIVICTHAEHIVQITVADCSIDTTRTIVRLILLGQAITLVLYYSSFS